MNYKGLLLGLLTATLSITSLASIKQASAFERSTDRVNIKSDATLLISAKKGSSKGQNDVKGGHSKGKSKSKQNKHQEGQARRNKDQNIDPAWRAYKFKGGKLSKDAWLKRGMPSK